MKKFYKYYDNEFIVSFDTIFQEYYLLETSYLFNYVKRYNEYEKRIEILSNIKCTYGDDIYNNIKKFM